MNLQETFGWLRKLAFRASRVILGVFDGGRISAFGIGRGKIGMVLIVNLDRQPQRIRQTLRELSRLETSDGASLASLARRLAAVDARDGRAVAATNDVDPTYLLAAQLYVQPDARLEECFGPGEPIRMTRQEVAVARSHIEAWKAAAAAPCDHVLVLEDDIWLRPGAARTIDGGWRAATMRCANNRGPHLLYLSYAEAGGTVARVDPCSDLFRPTRGLWFLSSYELDNKALERSSAALLALWPPLRAWISKR